MTFANACTSDTAVASLVDMEFETIYCTAGKTCPDGSTSTVVNPCEWTRKLCVTCTANGATGAKIRVQSNGMPNHCYYDAKPPLEQDIDYTVNFNW